MPEWVMQALGIAGASAGVYAAIRADLAYLRAKVENAHDSARTAHARIDSIIDRRGKA